MADAATQRRIVWFLEEVECGVIGGPWYELGAVSYGWADAGNEFY